MENIVELSRAAQAEYEANGTLPVLPPEMSHNDFAVMCCGFEKHPEIWKYIRLEECRRLATDSFERCKAVAESHQTMMKMTAMLCVTATRNYEGLPGELDISDDLIDCWFAVAKQYDIAAEFYKACHEEIKVYNADYKLRVRIEMHKVEPLFGRFNFLE